MQGPCALVPYFTPSGHSEVLDFLADLERHQARAYVNYLYAHEIITEHGTDHGAPHWKWLGDGLGEIRWRVGKTRYRIGCSEESGRVIVMLGAWVKKWARLEPDDRKLLLKRRSDFRSPEYDHTQRRALYLAKHDPHAGDE